MPGYPVRQEAYAPQSVQMQQPQPQYYNDADENEPLNMNTIVAQYKTENRVKSRFKFTIQRAKI